MQKSKQASPLEKNQNFFGYSYILLALISLAAIMATFFTAASNLDFASKKNVFLTIVLLYPALFFLVYVWQRQRIKILFAASEKAKAESIFNSEIENKLLALEEASEFFGASLKPADMFRLVASRINELIPFAACALFLANESGTKLKITMAAGDGTADLKNLEFGAQTGLAGKTFQMRQSQIDEKLSLDQNIFERENVLKNFNSAVATPLMSGAEAFGVLVLYADAHTS
ncbi:MAG: GAF domain-containing protein, partial [Acidobacteriota bacterium]|nr:GAF domain-containing protein [Acidobacteriota bacterium]